MAGTFHWHIMGVAYSVGIVFGPYLVDGRHREVASIGVEPKVSSSLNYGLLQYNFAPFSKAAK